MGWITREESSDRPLCPLGIYILLTQGSLMDKLETEWYAGPHRFVHTDELMLSERDSWEQLAEQYGYTPLESELDIPEALSSDMRCIIRGLRYWLLNRGDAFTGGCKAFWTPDEWRDNGYGVNSKVECVIVHDGGSLAKYFNMDYMDYKAFDDMHRFLNLRGYWAEAQTSCVTFIYKHQPVQAEHDTAKEL